MKKILIFRTDRLGDFIISKSVLNNLIHTKKYLIDIVVSEKNFHYIKNFKSFNNIYIFKNNFFRFIIENRKIFSINYDYILIHDGKRRSHLISLFLRGKKISLIKFSKNSLYYNFIKFFNFHTYYNSENDFLFNNLQFLNLLIDVKQKNSCNDFYFDYEFDNSFYFNNKKYCFFHLDEKWFKDHYYQDFTYPNWSFDFFNKIIDILLKKFNLPILITTGGINVKFVDDLIKEKFNKLNNNIYIHKELGETLYLINNLSFRQIEYILKENCNTLVSCEGGVTHLSHNLNIRTYAFVQPDRKKFYNHWTGHMKNISLHHRSNSDDTLKILSDL